MYLKLLLIFLFIEGLENCIHEVLTRYIFAVVCFCHCEEPQLENSRGQNLGEIAEA